MTASLLQLVCQGGEDRYLTSNPSITHFMQVYKRYTNFSCERIEIPNNESRQLAENVENEITFEIKTDYGDFLDSIYLQFDLPRIYSPHPYKFEWIKNIGTMMIREVYFSINQNLIEKIDDKQINLKNIKNLNNHSKLNYDRLVGNIDLLNDPQKYNNDNYPFSNLTKKFEVNLNSIKVINTNYSSIPSIPSYRLYIPIPLFFHKDSISKIPLVSLRDSTIKVRIVLRPLLDLYRIGIPESIKIRKNDYDYSPYDTNSYSEIIRYRYYKNNQIDFLNINDFLIEKNYFDNIKLSLLCHVYFCEKNDIERLLKENTFNIMNTSLTLENLKIKTNDILEIKNNDLVSSIDLIANKTINVDNNTWDEYSIIDNNSYNPKVFSNYYLSLCYEQYNNDLLDLNLKNDSSNQTITQFIQNSTYKIKIIYNDNDLEKTIIFDSTIHPFSQYSDYINSISGVFDTFHSPFQYYGIFHDGPGFILNSKYFRYKYLNAMHEKFPDEMKNLPSITINENILTINYNNPIYSSSILDNLNIVSNSISGQFFKI